MSTQTQVSPSTTVVAAESSESVKALGLTSATTIVMGSGSYGQLLDLTMFAVIIFLYIDDLRTVRPLLQTSGGTAAVSSFRMSDPAGGRIL